MQPSLELLNILSKNDNIISKAVVKIRELLGRADYSINSIIY